MIRPFADGIEHLQVAESAEIERVGERLKTVMMDVHINTVSVMIEGDCHSSIRMLVNELHIPECQFSKF